MFSLSSSEMEFIYNQTSSCFEISGNKILCNIFVIYLRFLYNVF